MGAASILLAAFAAGCAANDAEDGDEVQSTQSEELNALSIIRGGKLFATAKFGGNGRTCETCHSLGTGTISPAAVEARFAKDPNDPLFRALDSDDGSGNSYARLREHATFLIPMPLPPNISLADDPQARTVVLARGAPTVRNTPKLDKLLMVDGRETSVEQQARDAIATHFEPGLEPAARDIEDIANFERTLFSSVRLAFYAASGNAPSLPAGRTHLEKEGRRFFDLDAPPTDAKSGMCASCHGGPMLDRIPNPNLPDQVARFGSAFVSELNVARNPVRTFVLTFPDGTTAAAESPDPGRILVTGRPEDFNVFRIPTLWGVKKTAPYFHDNSANTLEEVVDQYTRMFDITSQFGGPPIHITPEDKASMVAYMKLL